jgi:hypothetical protein
MSIIASDIKCLLSGGAGNTNPNLALGGIISATEIVDDTLNNLFDDVTGAEHVVGDINYRCFYVKNNSAEIAYNVRIYIDSNTPAADDVINIGLDLGGLDATADTIADEHTAPDPAVTFSLAAGYANSLAIGDIPAGSTYPIWVKRIVSAGSTAQTNDNAVLKISVDTI